MALVEEGKLGLGDRVSLYLPTFVRSMALKELWRNADPELQPRVAAARRRIASLQQREPVTH